MLTHIFCYKLILFCICAYSHISVITSIIVDNEYDIRIAYYHEDTGDTVVFLTPSIPYPFVCGNIIANKHYNPVSFCGEMNEYQQIYVNLQTVMKPMDSQLSEFRSNAMMKDMRNSGVYSILEMIWSYYETDQFDTDHLQRTLNETYIVMKCNSTSSILFHSNPDPIERTMMGKDLEVEVSVPNGIIYLQHPKPYINIVDTGVLDVKFYANEFSNNFGSYMVFDCEGIIYQQFPMYFKTLEASNIEPGSWFCSLTPKYTLTNQDNNVMLLPPDNASVDRQSHMNLHSKSYHKNGNNDVVVHEIQNEPVLISGYSNYLHLEHVLSPQRIQQERMIVPKSGRRLSNAGQSVKKPGTGDSVNDTKSRRNNNSSVHICVFGSSKPDGQKHIWLQQIESLNHTKYRFTWIMSDIKAQANRAGLNNEADASSSKTAVELGLERLKEFVHVIPSPYDKPISFEALSQAPIWQDSDDDSVNEYINMHASESTMHMKRDVQAVSTHAVLDIWGNDPDVIYKYAINRLKVARYDINKVTPPWCRNIFQTMVNMIREQQCDIMVYGNSRGFSADVLITYVSRLMNVPTVSELLNLFTDPDIIPDYIIGPSTYSIDHPSITSLQIPPVQQDSVLKPRKPMRLVVSPGVDTDRFNPMTNSQPSKETNQPFVIGFIGRLAPEKNVGLFILTANYIIKSQLQRLNRNETPNVRFHVIGDGPMKPYMMQLCIMFDILEYVEFKGWLSGDAYVKAISSMSLLINPSLRAWSETFCIVNIEVMSMGVPIVTFGVGGIGEYIDEYSKEELLLNDDINMIEYGFEIHKNMILVNQASPDVIGNSILYIMNNRYIYDSISIAARKTILDSFTVQMQMEQYDSIYAGIMSNDL